MPVHDHRTTSGALLIEQQPRGGVHAGEVGQDRFRRNEIGAQGMRRRLPEQRLFRREAAGVFSYKTIEQGAATSIVAAVAPEFAHTGGHYLDDGIEA